jgi:TatD DNase family protein
VTDSHAHLDACDEPDAVVERSRAAGVTRIVTIGTGVDSSRAALALTERHESVVAALGVDPHQAATPDAQRLDELDELLRHPRVVAVGETGLDNYRRRAPMADQLALFEAQLDLATELAKPVVVHSRDAADETAAALARFAGTVVLHCFSSPELLPTALERDYYVSFAGNVTYPAAASLRQAAETVPSERLLIETDAPYLAPQPVRGRRNEPAYLEHTLAALAEVRGVSAGELERQTDENAARAFEWA